ncbi:DUF1697 domain-containing protein [Novosphingobium sp.]|uniref:DUF1697 domain-containing protein n=1 Tax=Novosphingobium sp. TaxID=1874826 RepID=UPI0025DB6F74|nr:DUF1697 domain-containing protein [Novosphingobium sp.]
MPRYVALFGSINVGGNRLTMADLRGAFEAEGFTRVETVVASGNVLFDHEARPDRGLEEKLSLMMRQRFGMTSVALVRSRGALAAAIAENPFHDGEEKFVHTLFLEGPVDPAGFARLSADRRGAERIAAGTCALHIDYCAGVAESKLVGAFIERRLGLKGTARNLRSMKRILAKMDQI